jgi:hypothetical protein
MKFYHATSAELFERIMNDGMLKPGIETGIRGPWRLGTEKLSDRTYLVGDLASRPGECRSSAVSVGLGIQHGAGGTVILLEVGPLDPQYLVSDEDSGAETWEESLRLLNMCGYTGRIPVSRENIRVHLPYDLPMVERDKINQNAFHSVTRGWKGGMMEHFERLNNDLGALKEIDQKALEDYKALRHKKALEELERYPWIASLPNPMPLYGGI